MIYDLHSNGTHKRLTVESGSACVA